MRSEKIQNLGGNSKVQYRIQGSQEYLEEINTEDNFILALKVLETSFFLEPNLVIQAPPA